MALDPFAELRQVVADQLARFWPAALHDDENAQLRDEVATEMAMMLGRDPAREVAFEDFEALDDDPEVQVDAARANSEDTEDPDPLANESLPLGARLKPRGIFEDDWTARPTAQRPWPVILLHGTCDTKGIWQEMGADLRADGWAVFAPDYGTRATGLIPTSARQVGAYIDTVLAATDSSQAIIIGHSQGGLLARYWMRVYGNADKVRHLVCLASPNHGTTAGGIISPLVATKRAENVMNSVISSWFGSAGSQQIAGHPLFHEVNGDGDVEEGVTYTCIATRSDSVIKPPSSCFLDAEDAPSGTVRNIYVQDFDRLAVVMHEDMPLDRRVRAIVRAVLKNLTLPGD